MLMSLNLHRRVRLPRLLMPICILAYGLVIAHMFSEGEGRGRWRIIYIPWDIYFIVSWNSEAYVAEFQEGIDIRLLWNIYIRSLSLSNMCIIYMLITLIAIQDFLWSEYFRIFRKYCKNTNSKHISTTTNDETLFQSFLMLDEGFLVIQ